MLFSQGGDNPVHYGRAQFRQDFFFELPKDLSAYISFRTGVETNFAKDPNPSDSDIPTIPLIKQYTLGGVGSLRGFSEQGLFIPRSSLIQRYASYVNYRFQVELPFAGQMRFSPFLDAANLNVDHYSLGELRIGTGVGFRYRSPVGPVSFDLGINPFPRDYVDTDGVSRREDSFKIHFSVGVY
jgi:translocation and assembly module TamA